MELSKIVEKSTIVKNILQINYLLYLVPVSMCLHLFIARFCIFILPRLPEDMLYLLVLRERRPRLGYGVLFWVYYIGHGSVVLCSVRQANNSRYSVRMYIVQLFNN